MAEALGNDNNYPVSPTDEALKQTKVSKAPFGLDHGFEVSVPTADQVEQSIPPAEHWPFAWIDIYTGESLNRRSFALMGLAYGGQAQLMYSKDEPILEDTDIKRLEDIASIRVRQTTANGTPGSCEIVLQNALEPITDKSGNLVWSRVDFKQGRFADGQTIRYMSTTPVNGNYWYKGTLKEVKLETDPHMVELEGRFFNVIWVDKAPPEAYDGLSLSLSLPAATVVKVLPAGRFYAEDAGEPIFEPMQKIKIYGVNRFQPEILTQFGYRTLNTAGATEDTSGVNTMIEDAATDSGIPHITDTDGKGLTPAEILQFSGGPAFQYASPIFTGYISDVTNQQRGANWEIRIQARDVTIWLDYSLLNINPSFNIFGREFSMESSGPFQLFTTRFESMPAHEIVRALFLGLEDANTIVATKLYFDKEMTKPITTGVYNPQTGSYDTEDIIIPAGAHVYIRDRYPPIEDEITDYMQNKTAKPEVLLQQANLAPFITSYKVGTDIGIEGWIPVWVDANRAPIASPQKHLIKTAAITDPSRSYPGLGFFREEISKKYPLVAIGSIKSKTMLPYDKLNIFNAIEPYNQEDEDSANDSYVVRAYERYFRQNWPLIQSDFTTRRSVLNEVCKASNCECYADGDGKVWFHPVWAYHSVKNLAYIIQQEECTSWSFTFSDREIVTWSQVTGEFMFDIPPGAWTYGLAIDTQERVEKYGVRALNMQNPNVKSAGAAVAYARSVMNRINSNKITGNVTVIMRPELQQANNVYIPWLNMVGYISSIEHAMQWGQQATTTIGLKYVRHPWERWTPIEYLEEPGREDEYGLKKGPQFGNPWVNQGKVVSETSTGTINEQDPTDVSTQKVPTDVGNTVGAKTPTGKMSKAADKAYDVIVDNNLFAPLGTQQRTRTNSAANNDETYTTAPADTYTYPGSSTAAVAARDKTLKYLQRQDLPVSLTAVPAANRAKDVFAIINQSELNDKDIKYTFQTAGFDIEPLFTPSRQQASIFLIKWKGTPRALIPK